MSPERTKGCVFLMLLVLESCASVIINLNDTEYARMPPLTQLDDYVQCFSQVDALYCTVDLTLHAEPGNELMYMIKEYSEFTSQRYNYTNIKHGICVTKTCKHLISKQNTETNESLEQTLEVCLNELYQNKYGLDAKITSVAYCNRLNENIETNYGDWVFVAVILAIVLINAVATVYDILLQGRQKTEVITGNQLILCFSLLQNWKRLVSSSSKPESMLKAFEGMNGLRNITTFFMILVHVLWLIADGYTDNPHDFEKVYESVFFNILFSGTVFIQLLFIISGIILSYSFKSYGKEKVPWSHFPTILAYRLCRLSPSYLLVLGFSMTWYRHIGSGPFWGMIVQPIRESCKQYWWTHILFINNLFADNNCSNEYWSMGAEVQMHIIGLIVLFATQKRYRMLGISLIFLIGIVSPALHVWWYDVDGVLVTTPEYYRSMNSVTFYRLYVLTANNIACFAIGLALGSFISEAHKKNITQIKKQRHPKYRSV